VDWSAGRKQLLEQIVATGKPVVLVVSWRPLTLPWAFERVRCSGWWFPGRASRPLCAQFLVRRSTGSWCKLAEERGKNLYYDA